MTFVIDASAVIDLLVRSDHGERVRRRLAQDTDATLVTVTHLDAEVFSGLARLHLAGDLAADEVGELLRRLARLDVRRIPIGGALLDAAWRMRDNIAARDALYVAAARDLGCGLLTTDQHLARAVPDLGTDTIKDTVTSALRASVQAAERRQRLDAAALKRFADASRDLLDDDVMAGAWR